MKRDDYILGLLRMGIGFIFLWAFFDKLIGLGFATASDKSWLAGVSPTAGFLEFGTSGFFVNIFKSMAGSVIIDWLFMMGLLLIGLCLVLGVARKIAGYSGALLMFLIWLAVVPPKNNPIIDEHIIYLLVLVFLASRNTRISFSKWWEDLSVVRKYSFLK